MDNETDWTDWLMDEWWDRWCKYYIATCHTTLMTVQLFYIIVFFILPIWRNLRQNCCCTEQSFFYFVVLFFFVLFFFLQKFLLNYVGHWNCIKLNAINAKFVHTCKFSFFLYLLNRPNRRTMDQKHNIEPKHQKINSVIGKEKTYR